MKKAIAIIALSLFAASAHAGFSSGWTLQRAIITDDHSDVLDTALNDNISIRGVMTVENDQYSLKGKMCDSRNGECVRIKQSLQILALSPQGLAASVVDKRGHESVVHILAREPNGYAPLNLFFTDTRIGATVTLSFNLVEHVEELPVFEFDDGVELPEGKAILQQLYDNHHGE